MNPRFQDAFEHIVSYLGDRVRDIDREAPTSASNMWENVVPLPGGRISAVGGATSLYADRAATINETYPRFSRSYGLDASTTRTIAFHNGVLLTVANATLGVDQGDKELRHHRSIVAGVYFDDGYDVDSYSTDLVFDVVEELGDYTVETRSEVDFLPDSKGYARSTDQWVSGAAQQLAEGRHLVRYVDDLDGPLFLDGALYPLSLVSGVLFPTVKDTQVTGVWMDVARDIVQNYIHAIERQLAAGQPVFGVTKTINTTEVVGSLAAKQQEAGEVSRCPWVTDYMYASDLLTLPQHDNWTWTFTSWIEQEPVEGGGRTVEPLEEFEFSEYDPADLRRAFFFVRVPGEGNVFRVETPCVFLHDLTPGERKGYQQRILSEMILSTGPPPAVEMADQAAGIRAKHRESMIDDLLTEFSRQGVETAPVREYNGDVRWSWLGEGVS